MSKIIADCCTGDSWQYMEIAKGKWQFVIWIAISQEGDETTWKAMAFPAEFCHNCGERLEAADRRNYFEGTFPPIDTMYDTLVMKEQVNEVLATAPNERPATAPNERGGDTDGATA